MSEYDCIYQFIEENEMVSFMKVIKVNGKSESYLINGLCDLIVCVVQTGKTLEKNNLKKLRLIKTSSFKFFKNNL